MLERAISGTVFVAIMLAAIYFGPLSLWVLMTVVALGCIWEYQKLLFDTEDRYFGWRRWSQLVVALLLLLLWYYSLSLACMDIDQSLWVAVAVSNTYLKCMIAIAILGIWTVGIVELFLANAQPFRQMAHWFFGLGFVLVPIMCYTLIAQTTQDCYDPMVALAPFLLIWTNDTMAYLSGRAIGRTAFFPRISPKKTWEGTIGGVICTMVLAWWLGPVLGGFSQQQWITAAFVVSIFGTLGDLVESMLKRSVGVKDSGNIMPGHGGFLDRFDSFIFAAPFLWLALFVLTILGLNI
jgi:phosphatidate cytidylyltransferase